ncbi:MAG: T9SS type A sorting domain-containing protein [Candidatus Eisenbacteria bacterium]
MADDRMLVTWHDELSTTNKNVEGRILSLDGTPLTGEILICDAPKEQMYPACGFSGSFFTVAWSDMRELGQVDQLRGDIYTSRVSLDGTVLDPGGIQVTSGPLPEDLPAVGGCDDVCIIAFSQLHGACGNPEVQRIGYVTVQELSVADVGDASPAPRALVAGPSPFREHVRISWSGIPTESLELEVFSATGRRIWTADLDASLGHVTWDGTSSNALRVPNGTYFIRLRSGDEEIATTRVVKVE